jgi:hypothetical protein
MGLPCADRIDARILVQTLVGLSSTLLPLRPARGRAERHSWGQGIRRDALPFLRCS